MENKGGAAAVVDRKARVAAAHLQASERHSRVAGGPPR